MKRVGIIMDDELHKQLKYLAVNEGRTVTDIIVAPKPKPVNPGITLYCK